jgi:hypothetical protein
MVVVAPTHSMISNTAIQFLHLFADQKRPLREWTADRRQTSLYLVAVKKMGTVEQHMAIMDALDEVVQYVEEYDPPAKK